MSAGLFWPAVIAALADSLYRSRTALAPLVQSLTDMGFSAILLYVS